MRYGFTRSLLVLFLLVVLSVPAGAAPSDRDNPGSRGVLERITRVVKKALRVTTNSDNIILPIPSSKP